MVDDKVAGLQAEMEELEGMIASCKSAGLKPRLARVLSVIRREEIQAGKEEAEMAKAKAVVAHTKSSPKKESSSGGYTALRWKTLDKILLSGLGSGDNFVEVDFRLEGVGNIPPENITCDFTERTFDLKVLGYEGQNWRCVKTNLEKEINADDSKIKIKKNHVVLKLKKKSEKFVDASWTQLCGKGKEKVKATSEDPTAGIMDLMKDMYNDGDSETKKMIGEAMMKSQEQTAKDRMGDMPDMKF